MPVGTSTQNRDIVIKQLISSSTQVSATSTDCFRTIDATATSTGPIILKGGVAAGEVAEFIDYGALCAGATSGTIWEQLSAE